MNPTLKAYRVTTRTLTEVVQAEDKEHAQELAIIAWEWRGIVHDEIVCIERVSPGPTAPVHVPA